MHNTRVQDLPDLDVALILRADYKIRTHLIRISNCPMKAKDIHRFWNYIHVDLGYKIGPLPFEINAPLSENALEWAHEESTTKRPLLISDAIHENPMLFHSTALTRSGRTHPGWERDSTATSSSFPMYSEHRMTLSALVLNPKSKRLEAQTRLVQMQPTLIPQKCEHYWSPVLIISGLGNAYSASKSCITGAVHAHLKGLLAAYDPDFENRYYRSAQLDWAYFQYVTVEGDRRTQPVATLRLCKNDPDDQTKEATLFAQKAGLLILGHIFDTSPAAHTTHMFCKFLLRVHRVDRSGTTQPLTPTLRRDLALPSPSDELYKITLQNLTPYPSLPLIHQRLTLIGLSGIENIAYVQIDSSRTSRQNRLDWMNPFQVAVFFSSAGNAKALLHPHNQNHISQCLSSLLEDIRVPLILVPPVNLPTVVPDTIPSLRFPVTYPNQAAVQHLYRSFSISSIYQHYASPAPLPPTTSHEEEKASHPQHSRDSSPKRSRQKSSTPSRPSSPQPFQPEDKDRQMYADITGKLQTLYNRLPTETYLFIADLVERMRVQIVADGLMGDPDASQASEFVFSNPTSSSHRSSQSADSSQPFSQIEFGESATEVDQADI